MSFRIGNCFPLLGLEPPGLVEWMRVEEQKYYRLLFLADVCEIPHEMISRWLWKSRLPIHKAIELLARYGRDAIPDDCIPRVCEGD